MTIKLEESELCNGVNIFVLETIIANLPWAVFGSC